MVGPQATPVNLAAALLEPPHISDDKPQARFVPSIHAISVALIWDGTCWEQVNQGNC
jgi:hypothetical protein